MWNCEDRLCRFPFFQEQEPISFLRMKGFVRVAWQIVRGSKFWVKEISNLFAVLQIAKWVHPGVSFVIYISKQLSSLPFETKSLHQTWDQRAVLRHHSQRHKHRWSLNSRKSKLLTQTASTGLPASCLMPSPFNFLLLLCSSSLLAVAAPSVKDSRHSSMF